MGVGVAEDPTGAVDVEDDGQGTGGRRRPDDPGADDAAVDVAGAAVDGHPFLVDVWLVDRAALDVVDGGAPLLGRQLVEEGRLAGRLGEGLGRRLERQGVWVCGHGEAS